MFNLLTNNSLGPIPNIKVLLIINADTSERSGLPIDRSQERLVDYAALKTALNADVVDWNSIKGQRWTRLLAKICGKGVALAALAFSKNKQYQAFYCDSENNSLVLALLFKLGRLHKPLLTIGHWITSPKKAVLFKFLKLHQYITVIFLHSSTQYQKAIEQLGIPASKLTLLPYQVDTQFWQLKYAKSVVEQAPYICTAGLEYRDYATLIEAIRDIPVQLKIGAASHWSKRINNLPDEALPENVAVASYNYQQLRDLYAGSRFVVVPLYDVDFQAGITVILEAMAMSKAVIVTRSSGQGDTIVDARSNLHGRVNPPVDTKGKFTYLFGSNKGADLSGSTGFYVNPGDSQELAEAIKYLLEHPDQAEAMGKVGRRTVETLMSVEQFTCRIIEAILEAAGVKPDILNSTTTLTYEVEASKAGS